MHLQLDLLSILANAHIHTHIYKPKDNVVTVRSSPFSFVPLPRERLLLSRPLRLEGKHKIGSKVEADIYIYIYIYIYRENLRQHNEIASKGYFLGGAVALDLEILLQTIKSSNKNKEMMDRVSELTLVKAFFKFSEACSE